MKNLQNISFLFAILFLWSVNAQSQWSQGTMDDPTYREGNVGVGTDDPQGRVDISATRSGDVISSDGGGLSTGGGGTVSTTPPFVSPHLRLSTNYTMDGQISSTKIWDIDATNSLNFKFVENSGTTVAMGLSKAGLTVYGNYLYLGNGNGVKFKVKKSYSHYGQEAFHIGFGLRSSSNTNAGTFFDFNSGGSGGSVIQGDANGNMLFITKLSDGQPYIGGAQNLDYAGMVITGNQDVLIGASEALDHPATGDDYKLFVRGGMVANEVKVENKVFIGTNNIPEFDDSDYDYKLVVNGGAIAKEIKVRSDFADYVFEENYQLLSLKEVESHIQANGHLHNTPSAKEIQKNGLAVGKITTNQQEKIEELFLHLIDMEKRIIELETENKKLKSQNSKN